MKNICLLFLLALTLCACGMDTEETLVPDSTLEQGNQGKDEQLEGGNQDAGSQITSGAARSGPNGAGVAAPVIAGVNSSKAGASASLAPGSAASRPPLAGGAAVNKIAAVVNGQIITMHDLRREAYPDFVRARINPAAPGSSQQVDAIYKKALDNMIMDILVTQEAKRLSISVSKSEVDQDIAKMMQARRLTKKQLEEQLARQKMTVDGLRKTFEKNILRQKVMGMEVGRRVVVTPQEIKDYYEAHKGELFDRSGLHMGLLVYNPRVDAAGIARQIKAGKLSFAEACAKYSIAPNRDKSGDQGPVEWDKLNPEWGAKLGKMKPGDVTDLFPLQNFKAQMHLFRPGGGEEKQLTLQEATPQIDSILRMPKARERFGDYSRQLREKAVIDIRM